MAKKKITGPNARVTIKFKGNDVTTRAAYRNVNKIEERYKEQIMKKVSLASGALAMAEKKGLLIDGTSYTFTVILK